MRDQYDSTGWYHQNGWQRDCRGRWYPPDRLPGHGWWLAGDGVWYPRDGWWLASDGKLYPPVVVVRAEESELNVPRATRIFLILYGAFWLLLAFRAIQFQDIVLAVAAMCTTSVVVVTLVSARWGRPALLVLAVAATTAPMLMGVATQNEDWAFVVSVFLVMITAPSLGARSAIRVADSRVAFPPAGWYADPDDPGSERYWTGAQWTESRRPASTT